MEDIICKLKFLPNHLIVSNNNPQFHLRTLFSSTETNIALKIGRLENLKEKKKQH